MDQHVTKYYILRIAHYIYGHSIYPVCLRWTFVPKKYGCGNPITSFWLPPCTVRVEHKNGDRKNILRFITLPYNSVLHSFWCNNLCTSLSVEDITDRNNHTYWTRYFGFCCENKNANLRYLQKIAGILFYFIEALSLYQYCINKYAV